MSSSIGVTRARSYAGFGVFLVHMRLGNWSLRGVLAITLHAWIYTRRNSGLLASMRIWPDLGNVHE